MNRLEKLEQAHGKSGTRIQLIERVIVDPRQGPRDPEVYRDELGNRWTRESDEQFEQFHARVTAEAIAKAQPGIAVIVGDDR